MCRWGDLSLVFTLFADEHIERVEYNYFIVNTKKKKKNIQKRVKWESGLILAKKKEHDTKRENYVEGQSMMKGAKRPDQQTEAKTFYFTRRHFTTTYREKVNVLH